MAGGNSHERAVRKAAKTKLASEVAESVLLNIGNSSHSVSQPQAEPKGPPVVECLVAALGLVAEFLAKKYGMVWLAWVAGFFVWIAIIGSVVKYVHSRRLKFASCGIVTLAFIGTVFYLAPSRANPQSDFVLAPNRASLRIASIRAWIECLSANGSNKLSGMDDPSIFGCHASTDARITNFGPATIAPNYQFTVGISLQNRPLSKVEEDSLFRKHIPKFAIFEGDNSMYGYGSEVKEASFKSPIYLRKDFKEWWGSSRLILVTANAYYVDDMGPLFTEECFYLLPPNFTARQPCEGHNSTYARKPSYW